MVCESLKTSYSFIFCFQGVRFLPDFAFFFFNTALVCWLMACPPHVWEIVMPFSLLSSKTNFSVCFKWYRWYIYTNLHQWLLHPFSASLAPYPHCIQYNILVLWLWAPSALDSFLCSASAAPHFKLETSGVWVFRCAAPWLWNSLPLHLQQLDSDSSKLNGFHLHVNFNHP